MKNLYAILGVSKSATDAEIKKAFRTLAKELHPDHNQGDAKVEERFKEVSAAYAILGDKTQRAKYDNGEIDDNGQPANPFAGAGFGGGAGAGGGPYGGGGFEDIFRQFTGGARGGAGRGGRTGGSGSTSGDPFADLFGGFGRGGRKAAEAEQTQSQGSGFGTKNVEYKITIPFMEAISGTKRNITLQGGKTLKVTIPAGVREGQQIRLAGQGQKGFTGSGDALLTVHLEKHPFFKRDGDDIYIDVPLAVDEAMLGAKITVPTVHGDVSLNVPAYTNSGKKLRLRGKGVKNGDQYVTLQIVWPDEPDPELEKAIKNWRVKSFYRPRNGKGKK